MKTKIWCNLFVLVALLAALVGAAGAGVAQEEPQPAAKPSGMPGRPIPTRPIPHHEPGQVSKAANVGREVTRRSVAGVEQPVELHGMEALLADGTMSDPLVGNYSIVNLDQILLARNVAGTVETEAWSAFVEPDVIATPGVIPSSLASVGTTPVWGTPAIASGDLNGDNMAEQITAWRDLGTAMIFMSIGELPGTQGQLTSDPAAVAHNDGTMDLLVRGYDSALWHRHYDGAAWGEWDNYGGGYLTSGPALASRGDGQFDVFVAGVYSDTTAIYQRHWNGAAWSADWDLVDVHPTDGVELVGDPAAIARGTDQVDVFRRASDGTLRWLHYDGSAWETWQNLGGFITSAPVVVSLGADHLQVFAQGFDGALWYRALNGTLWSNWGLWRGLELTSKPTAVSPVAGQVDVYARGEDQALWRVRFNGSTWSDWESLGGVLGSAAAAVVHDARIDLFAQTADDPDTEEEEPDGYLQQKSYDGAAWAAWQDQGGLKTCCFTHDLGFQSGWVVLETGHFSGDGREQIVLAYAEGGIYGIRLYDVKDGFTPELLATPWVTTTAQVRSFDVTTGDLNGDGRDEIGLVVSTSDDQWTWENNLHILNVITGTVGSWALEEVWLEEDPHPSWLDDAKYVITSGDLDGNGDDEFATAWSRCWWWTGWYDPVCDAKLSLYDHEADWNISLPYSITFTTAAYKAYPNLDLAAADLDLDPETRGEEIIYAGPDGEPVGGQVSKGKLAVWSASPLTASQQITMVSFPMLEFPFRLTVGDFDRDLRPEVAFLNHSDAVDNPMNLTIYGYEQAGNEPLPGQAYDPGQFVALASVEQPQTSWSIDGRFDLAAGDLTGQSLRVGPPTYRREKSANTIIAIINTPPTHRDTLDGQEYVIGASDDTFAEYTMGSAAEQSISHAFTANWKNSLSMSTGLGDPRGTHFTAGVNLTYGAHFEVAGVTAHTVKWNQTTTALEDDVLVFAYTDYGVWEYPVYYDADRTPDGYIATIFPIPGSSGTHHQPGRAPQSWYKPTHQVGNIWSYPLDEVDFNGYDSDNVASHLYSHSGETGGVVYEWNRSMSQYDETQLNWGAYFGSITNFEVQVGGDEVEVSGGFLFVEGKMKTRTPFFKGTTRDSYEFEYLGQSTSSVDKYTSVANKIDAMPLEYSYATEGHLFWAEEGYLKLDHTADPQPTAFWNRYDKPDPTFIRPWADGACGEEKKDYTRDITIQPFYANPGETVVISATVRNYSNVSAYDVRVRFYLGNPDDGGRRIGTDQIIPTLARAVGPETVSVEWTASGSGLQRIYAVVDPDDELEEMHDEVNNVNNNKGYNLIKIGQADYIDPAMSEEQAYYRLAYGRDPNASAAASLSSETQTQSLTFEAYVAPTNLEEIVLFSFTSLDEVPAAPQGMAPIGDVVALEAFQVGSQEEVFDLKPSPASPPGIITVQYSEADLQGTPEEDLRFYTWTDTGWVEPACAGHTLLHLPEYNLFVVPLCETGTVALFGEGYTIHLPIVIKNN